MNRRTKVSVKSHFTKVAGRFAAIPFVMSLLMVAFAALPYSRDLRGETKGRWITLLDGKSLDDWYPIGPANWHLLGGAAVVDAYNRCLGQLIKLGYFKRRHGLSRLQEFVYRFRDTRRVLGLSRCQQRRLLPLRQFATNPYR